MTPEEKKIKRAKNKLLIDKFISRDSGCACIQRADLLSILTEEQYLALLKNKLKNKGPTPDLVYYWNVLDFMGYEDTSKSRKSRAKIMKHFISKALDLLGWMFCGFRLCGQCKIMTPYSFLNKKQECIFCARS